MKPDEWSDQEYAYETRKVELWMAMTERPLTDKELTEAIQYGPYLSVNPRSCYNGAEELARINNALLVQQMLRGGVKTFVIDSVSDVWNKLREAHDAQS